MFESINQLLLSAEYRPKLDKVIDLTHAFLIDPDKEKFYADKRITPDPEVVGQFKVFDQNAPYREANTFKVLEFALKRNQAIASITAVGGQVPSTSMGQFIKIEGGMAKITLSHIYDEQTMQTMIEMKNATIIPDDFVDLLFGNVNDLQTKIFKTGNVLTAQAWYMGRIQFTDPRTNMQLEMEYDIRPELFPAPLVGNRTWDNHDTATGIRDLIDHSNLYYDVNSVYPECYKMSNRALTNLLQQESTANYAISMNLISAQPNANLPSRVTKKILDEMAESMDEMPKIEKWDAKYEVEIRPNVTVAFPYLPTHSYCVVQPNAVERLWGLTVESGMGQRGFGSKFNKKVRQAKGGIFLRSNEDLSLSPPICRSLGVGRMIPFVADGRRLAGRKVLPS